jgi:glutamate-1-semialdehyde 2,1-aminomutase
VRDADGKSYIDYVQSYGPHLFGHAPPFVRRALSGAMRRGTSFGAPTALEVRLAERVTRMVPSVAMVRFVNSGTEATMSAVRLARAATGRGRIVKTDGGYHGHADGFLVSAGSGVATLAIAGSPGVAPEVAALTVVVPYNDAAALEAAFERFPGEIAAFILEPVAANMGLVPADPGFLEQLAALCAEHGALFVCDEVITGFRLGPAGAQGRFGLTPDLSIFGKVIGGGLPLAAVGGRADVMDRLAPLGDVYQAGTLSGNPLATAAGLAALGALDPDAYRVLEDRVTRFSTELRTAVAGTGIDVQVPQVVTLSGLCFAASPVRNYEDAKAVDHEAYARFFHAMLARGVFLAPSGYEVMFVSLAHTEADLERTVALAADAAREVAAAAAASRA